MNLSLSRFLSCSALLLGDGEASIPNYQCVITILHTTTRSCGENWRMLARDLSMS